MSQVIDHRPARQQGPATGAPSVNRVRRDPAPSRLQYRLERMWLRPAWRRLVRLGLPALLVALIAGIWLSDEDRRATLRAGIDGIISKVQHREEFMVRTMAIEGASPAVEKALLAMLPADLPASSFDLNLPALRLKVMQLDAVESVDLRVRPGGVLAASVRERVPALLWRNRRGIDILDAGGHRVASVTSREVRADLPLIAGEGADRAASEALALIDAAGPILPRVRGLVRRGERRWDLVLNHNQRIMLPAEGAQIALEAAVSLHLKEDLLGRDIDVIDLRDPKRPVMRLGINARNTIRAVRGIPLLGPDGRVMDDKRGG